MIRRIISKVAAVVMTVCIFAMHSCADPDIPLPEVSVRNSQVPHTSGSMFVSVRCEGDWMLSVEYPGAEQDWASISVQSGNGDKNNVILSYKTNTLDEDRTLTLVVTGRTGTGSCTLTQLAYSETVVPGPSVEPEVELSKTGWLELPAMRADSDLEYYSHSFEMNGRTIRNWSFGWSQEHLVSVWVAYPLCKLYTNSGTDRTNEWNYDPLLGMEKSSAPFGGYGGSYARGHQIPSADRLCCREANVQTFYGTNMTPQLNGHNEGVWATLEGAVRNWANTSDTTYVVTGCVVKGSTKKTVDSDGKSMTVPVAYYKALIRYHKSSTISQWAGAAFYTEHKDYGNVSLKALSMSIDELEEITGLDFFVNLPERVGEAKAAELEAQDPETSNIWW